MRFVGIWMGMGQRTRKSLRGILCGGVSWSHREHGVAADVPVRGYELTGDLDFGKNPASWESIGILQKPFQAVLEGRMAIGY